MGQKVTDPALLAQLNGGGTYTVGAPQGMIQPGNLNLDARTVYHGRDRDHPGVDYRTENSMSIGTDAGEVLIPTVVNGRQLTPEQAIEHYQQTGESLGSFASPDAADAYAQSLHERQAAYYAPKSKVTDPALLAQLNGTPKVDPSALANLPMSDLPTPGNPNFDPSRPQTPNYTFGTSRGATLNPLPMIASAGNNIAASVPIAGPYLKQTGEKVDAAFANLMGGGPTNLNDLITGKKPVTPEDIAARNAEMDRQNPGAATVGKVVGSVAPYAVAAELPLINQVLGMSGAMLPRLGMTVASQQAINTGDNMAHGQDLATAASNAVMPSLLAGPAALLGPTGAKMTPQRAAALDVMKKEGIPLTGGQAKMSKKTMYMESQLGGKKAQDFQETQLKAFTKSALKAAGVASDVADPAVLRQAYDDVGNKFSNLASITKPVITAPIYRDMLKVADDYQQLKGVNSAPVLESVIQRIGTMASGNGGLLKGDQYKTLITDIRKNAEATTDVELKAALGELRELVDDAVEKSINGPKTLEAWQKLRAQYRNLITVTDAVAGGGEMALMGIIDPVSLNNAVRNNVGKRSYAKGFGDLNELSRAGRLVMPKLPDAGTASRVSAFSAAGGVPMAGYFASQGDMKALAATAAAAAAPYVAGRAMLSKPGRAWIAKDGSTIPSTVSRGLLPLLMGQ